MIVVPLSRRLVRRSFIAQAAKVEPLRDAARAANAIKDRVRWSDKLRADHRLIAALEKLMQQMGPAGAEGPSPERREGGAVHRNPH